MLRNLWRIPWSSGLNVVQWLCWKYFIQPRRLRLTSSMMSSIESGRFRSVFGPECVLQFVQALLAGPAVAALKVVSQKIEASRLAGVDDACLGRMQGQSCL